MDPVGGGCLCRRIRYEYRGEVGPAAYCHCEDCRRCTGGAFNVGVRLEAAGFRVLLGEPKAFTKTADSGHSLTRHFCTDCGSPIYTSSPRHPTFVYVKAGSLDDPTIVKPVYQSWTSSAVTWAFIPSGLSGYEKGRGNQGLESGGNP